MAVEAVVSVVIQNVTDLLIQESIIFDKVVDQVEDIRLKLRQMRGFLTDAEERQKDDDDAKRWVRSFLNMLYNVEDVIESYVITLVHKKMKIRWFQNYGFYFHDLTACWKLRRKMKQIAEEVEELKKGRPRNIQDASLRRFSSGREQKQLVLDITPEQNLDSLGDKDPSTNSFSETNRLLSGLYEDDDSDLVGFEDDTKFNFKYNEKILANWGSTDLWLLGYADLPAHYKLCLLYLTLFPKEFDLSVRRLIRLWLAEGFLQCPPGLGEDLAEECFNDLVRRKLVKISKFRSDGGPKKCCLPGFLHEVLLPKAQEISLFHIHHTSAEQRKQQPPNKNPTEKSTEQSILPVRRIVEYADIKDQYPDSDFQNLRSYLSFNFQMYDTPAKGVENFLRRIIGSKGFGMLRVLDLEGVYKPILPTTLKYLFQLRYLGLRWTFLDNLPESVGDLPYLETLDLKRTCINTLPSSVWKLEHLRHLNLPQVRLDMRMQQPSSQLLTLWGLIIDDGCNMENGLNRLDDLRELGITCRLKNFGNLLKWITRLTHLQSLSLASTDEMGRPSSLNLEPLSELRKLTHLELLGSLSPQLNKDHFPQYIRVLTLSVSNLKKDPMGILSQLQCLSVLRLLAKSYDGQTMHCPGNGFSNLRVLKLWMLNKLEEWVVEQRGMPKIKELNLRCCENLKELPHEFLERSTLKELILTSMPEEFQKNVREKISEHTNLQINTYQFTPLPWEKEDKLWPT